MGIEDSSLRTVNVMKKELKVFDRLLTKMDPALNNFSGVLTNLSRLYHTLLCAYGILVLIPPNEMVQQIINPKHQRLRKGESQEGLSIPHIRKGVVASPEDVAARLKEALQISGFGAYLDVLDKGQFEEVVTIIMVLCSEGQEEQDEKLKHALEDVLEIVAAVVRAVVGREPYPRDNRNRNNETLLRGKNTAGGEQS